LWKWSKRHAPLPSRTTFCLYLAAPVLGAQAITNNWPILHGIHISSPALANALLWLNVLLPWLLVWAFAAAREQADKPVAVSPVTAP
jgi:hypothetical protein